MITVGIFSLFQIEFDLTILTAILAVVGYSLNETIVVLNRIRENFRLLRTGTSSAVRNQSINQTLTRTVITSLKISLVLLSLNIFADKNIGDSALALIFGVTVCTYSSIFVDSIAVLRLGITKEDLITLEKKDIEIDSMP